MQRRINSRWAWAAWLTSWGVNRKSSKGSLRVEVPTSLGTSVTGGRFLDAEELLLGWVLPVVGGVVSLPEVHPAVVARRMIIALKAPAVPARRWRTSYLTITPVYRSR